MSEDIIYIVTDCEFDGPAPGLHSMLSFACVAVSASGTIHGEFEACLSPLPAASTDTETMAFWQAHPDAYGAATCNPEPPAEVMKRFTKWVRSLGGLPIFASHPVTLDGLWLDYYLRRFTDDQLLDGPWHEGRLFKGFALCLASLATGLLGRLPTSYASYPDAWLGNIDHTHKAIDDARGYAHLLVRLLSQVKPPS